MDLVDFSKLFKFNDGYKFNLVRIDILSKYLWVRPLKFKTATVLKTAIEDIFTRGKHIPKVIQFDAGKEL